MAELCEESFKSSLAIYKRLVEDNPRAYEPNLANLYERMALLYCNIQWFKKSEDMFIASLTIYKRLVEENPNAYEPELAKSYNDLDKKHRDVHFCYFYYVD